MATRMKATGLNGMHTAGIFSDMTVDGPEIGTLVVIVDRAKNLPNRKTIGKQDPYCAARLGKEAKKTETDRRGGQTPRWDQELRFTVHDSPDYYQLKVSVFNDDKKTDLIGENWVSLQDVVVPGGGQSDVWHNLNCKGKYAGEIRIEITYYDTRPKQEKVEKVKQSAATTVEEGGRDSLKGPRQPKAAVKRRPLPSDPVTGAPPPNAIPDHVQTPPRGYKSPGGTPEQVQTPPRGYELPSNGQEYAPAPSRHQPQNTGPDHHQTPPRGYEQLPNRQEYGHTPPRHQQVNGHPDYAQTPSRGAPLAIPQHVQPSPRGHQGTGYIPNQSPLQSVEYSPSVYSPSPVVYESSSKMNGYAPAPTSMNPAPHDRYDMYESAPRNEYPPAHGSNRNRYDDEDDNIDPRDSYDRHAPYELPQPEEFGSPPSPGGPPPPPPAHGSRAGSSHVSPQPLRSNGSYGFSSDSRSSNMYDSPPKEVHRPSISAYSQPKPYMAYVAPINEDRGSRYSNTNYQDSSPRHNSYDARYNNDYGSMQPTVEDAPPSPSGRYSGHRGSESHSPGVEDRRYDEVPSPAPLNLSGRGSAASGHNSASNTPGHQYSNSAGYAPSSSVSNSQVSMRDRSQTGTSVSSRTSYNTMSQQHNIPRKPSTNQISQIPELGNDYGLPPVPATLVAGMDPTIAQEISDRIYDERRASFSNQNAGQQPRGSYQDSPQYQQNVPHQTQHYQDGAMVPYAPPLSSSYDERSRGYGNSSVPRQKPRGVSPDPRTPARKSVSPSPGHSEDRRLSGVPFGPDSYNALNPSVSASKSTSSLSARYDTSEPDPDAKIITHDGREIDPSDHIPESNYAPLLESKGPKYASQQPHRNYRAPPQSNSQPGSGRRQLKVAARPQSIAASPSPAVYMGTGPNDPLAAQNGRNRLQKKANRMSAMPAPHSSPLAPINPYQNNSHTPRSANRQNTGDYNANENYSPNYSAGYRGSAGPPPIPAKVPVDMSSAPPPQSGGGDAWALLEEMKNIDLGSGRARRRGY